MGQEGTIPSMTVFGTLPTFPTGETNNRDQVERMVVIKETKGEMSLITAELRVSAALKARLPLATKFDFATGQRIRVYRESSRRWEGPFTISRIAGKQVSVSHGEKVEQLICTQILPYPADIAEREMSRLQEGF